MVWGTFHQTSPDEISVAEKTVINGCEMKAECPGEPVAGALD